MVLNIPHETIELRNFQWSLDFAGFWWDPSFSLWEKFKYYFKFFNFFVYIALMDVSLARIPLPEIPYKPYAPLTLYYNVMYCTVISFFLKREDLVRYKHSMSRLLSKYRAESERFAEMNSYVWKFAMTFMVYSMSGILLLALPGIIDLVLMLFTDADMFYIPFVMEGLLDKKERGFQLYFLNFINLFTQILPLTYYVFFIADLPAIITHAYFALEVMEKRLQLWDSLHKNDPNRRNIFREIVNDHVEALRLLDLIKSIFAPNYFAHNIVFALNTGYYAHFSRKGLTRGDLGVTISEAYLSLHCLSGMFLSCFIGQILFEKGREMSHTIYSLDWMDKSPSDQRDLMMVMLRSQKPVVIAYKNTFPLNLYTFTELIHKSYALFVLLGTIQAD